MGLSDMALDGDRSVSTIPEGLHFNGLYSNHIYYLLFKFWFFGFSFFLVAGKRHKDSVVLYPNLTDFAICTKF